MEITSVGYSPLPIDLARKNKSGQNGAGFMEAMSSALKEVSNMQDRADEMAVQLAIGKDVDIHDAVLATEEAQLAFNFTLQIRNKLIEAYQEVMRMQV
ncbi:MAG: flagellar hook-basal body complex protein FliE [Chloroflexota bacterium]|jgi:flagellar hook-basal body complex protein FliE